MKNILRRIFRRSELDSDVREEIESHIAMRAELNRESGMPQQDADVEARRRFGNATSVREEIYHFNGFGVLENILRDVRYAVRTLVKSPSFTAVALLSLSIGIGANTAVFSVIDPLFVKKLPLPRPEELVSLGATRPDLRIMMPGLPEALSGKLGFARSNITYREFERLRDNNDVFAGIFVFGGRNSGMRLLNAAGEVNAQGDGLAVERVSNGFFQTLGAVPALGRTFVEDDERAGASPVGIISYALWQRQFGLDPNIVGKTLTLVAPSLHPADDDVRTVVTIVGVATRGFSGLEVGSPSDMWVPLQGRAAGSSPKDYDWWGGYRGMARLKPGISAQQAQTSANTAFARMQDEWAREFGASWTEDQRDQFAGQKLALESAARGWSDVRDRFRQQLFVLMAAVASVLFIACANVAVLLLARGNLRRKELAIRMSIGSGRGRIVRQLLIESLTIAGVSAVLGLIVARWGARLLVAYTPDLAGLDIGLDARLLLFTITIAAASAVVSGLVPALRSTQPDLNPSLKDAYVSFGRTRSRFALNKLLIGSQIALSLVLLVGAGLFVRTLQNLMNIDTGFDRENVVVFDLDRSVDLGRLGQLFTRLEGLPGIQSATTWDTGMLGQGVTMVGPVRVDGHVPRPGEDLWSFATSVGPRFFETVGISLLAGRDFRPEDAGREVAVISETMARLFFGNQNPIGRSYNPGRDPKFRTEIIGVAEDTKYASLTGDPPRVTYTPLSLNPANARSAKFAVRISSSPAAVANAVTSAVKELDSGLQVTRVQTLQETVLGTLVQPRFIAHLASLFSVLALFLACVGLYGTLSNAVMHRTNEIGIRMALGARAIDVLTMLMRETGWILAGGLLAGLAGAALAGQAISSLLFGLTPTDPSTFAAAVLLLIVAAAIAAYVPARRASRVDPVIALRHD